MEIEGELRQAELILGALGWCSDEHHYDMLLVMAREILKPYWAKSHPRALWLKSGMPNLGEDTPPLGDAEFDQKYDEIIRLAAEGGCPEAQYRHGCKLYELGEQSKAAELYLKAAQEDFAPAQWCYGLDVLNGNGVDQNEEIGLSYIRMAAEQRYEYAVEFMIDAYQNGRYGGSNDESELQKWQRILPFCEYRY
ncbi:tetratricopeptide repeat protein [Marinobacter sp. M1N3S26]|uniref:tetratricopeptide repeat protein n=1 Tax=Marinobacter sp. M1N3S26 TaxID=3382299 RepID=UPI00387B0E45